LRDAVQDESHWADTASKEEGQADFWVEEPARRAEEEPSGHEQAESKGRRDVERLLDGRALYVVRCLHAAKRQEQEHGRPHKLEEGCLYVLRQARVGPEISEVRPSRRHRETSSTEAKSTVHPLYRVGPKNRADCVIVVVPAGPRGLSGEADILVLA
jgi:hypothetical protein